MPSESGSPGTGTFSGSCSVDVAHHEVLTRNSTIQNTQSNPAPSKSLTKQLIHELQQLSLDQCMEDAIQTGRLASVIPDNQPFPTRKTGYLYVQQPDYKNLNNGVFPAHKEGEELNIMTVVSEKNTELAESTANLVRLCVEHRRIQSLPPPPPSQAKRSLSEFLKPGKSLTPTSTISFKPEPNVYNSSVFLGAAVRECVLRGADIFYKSLELHEEPILHYFIRNGSLHAVAACLEDIPPPPPERPALRVRSFSRRSTTSAMPGSSRMGSRRREPAPPPVSRPLDFTTRDQHGQSVLHLVCLPHTAYPVDEQEAPGTVSVCLLMLIVERLLSHQLDEVDWGQKEWSEGKDFATLAFENGKAAIFWPIVQNIPYFSEVTSLLPEPLRPVRELFPPPSRCPADRQIEEDVRREEEGMFFAPDEELAARREALEASIRRAAEEKRKAAAARDARERKDEDWWSPHTPLEMAKLLKARARGEM